MKIKIVGLKIKKYKGRKIIGEHRNFNTVEAEKTKHVLYGKDKDKNFYKITLKAEENLCPSGFDRATYGYCKIKKVKKLPKSFDFKCSLKSKVEINEISDETNEDIVNNELFYCSKHGGEEYYPSGSYRVNMDYFYKKK